MKIEAGAKAGAKGKDLSGSLPAVYEGNADFAGGTQETLQEAALMDAADGLLLIGPPAANGSSDTWFLENGTKKILPGLKRVSDSKIGCLAAAVYNGSVYVIGSSVLEPGERVFRTDTLGQILPAKAPPRTRIKKLKKKGSTLTFTWAKRGGPVKGYQVRYSTKKNLRKATVTTVEGASKTRLKVTKIKKNKKYYIQVRTYKVLAGQEIYSAWSKKKTK